MERQNLVPPDIGKPLAPYSHGVLSRQPQAIVHTAGQVGMRADGSVAEGAEAQCEQIYVNLAAILREAGMSMQNVVQIRAYLTDASQLGAHRGAFEKWLGTVNPVSTAVIVTSLVSPDFLVEVEAVAVR